MLTGLIRALLVVILVCALLGSYSQGRAQAEGKAHVVAGMRDTS